MTTEEMLALRKEREAQVANMSIEQVINGLKNDDPLFGLIARLYVARCMEWATETAGDASQMKEYLRQALTAASQAAGNAADSESWAAEALDAAQRLGAMEQEGKLLLRLLEDTNISENKAAYLAFLSRAAVPSVFKLETTGNVRVEGEDLTVFADYERREYNTALSPVTMHVDSNGIITFSDDCDLLISAKCTYGLNSANPTSEVHTCVDYYDAATSSWPTLIGASDRHTAAGSLTHSISNALYSYKKGTQLRYIAQNYDTYPIFSGGKGNVTYIQFIVLPNVSRFPTGNEPVIIETGEIDQVMQSVGTASAAAAQANTAAQTAEGAATSLSQAAAQAQTAAASAGDSAASSESWAVGGTGTRPGEDTNNAKYWSKQAENVAGGGVTSFNGRAGVVLPQAGDYTAADVGADPEGLAVAVQGNLDLHAYNTTLHLDNTERDAWNAKLDESKIQLTQTAPEAGDVSSFPDGTLLFVYEVG